MSEPEKAKFVCMVLKAERWSTHSYWYPSLIEAFGEVARKVANSYGDVAFSLLPEDPPKEEGFYTWEGTVVDSLRGEVFTGAWRPVEPDELPLFLQPVAAPKVVKSNTATPIHLRTTFDFADSLAKKITAAPSSDTNLACYVVCAPTYKTLNMISMRIKEGIAANVIEYSTNQNYSFRARLVGGVTIRVRLVTAADVHLVRGCRIFGLAVHVPPNSSKSACDEVAGMVEHLKPRLERGAWVILD